MDVVEKPAKQTVAISATGEGDCLALLAMT